MNAEDQAVTPSSSPEELAELFARTREEALPPAPGFSARLNMLWDLAGAAPPQSQGRTLSILAINPAWRESDVRSWLQKDVLPPPLDLRNMVAFLAARLQESHNVQRWEAFLVFGSPIVSSPINHSMYRQDQARRDIASKIFAQVTHEYGVPPSAYDADKVFQRCLTLMHKFNIYELRDFQPGHLEPFKNYMFDSD